MDKTTSKATRAQQLGFSFFILLAIANVIGDMLDGKFRAIDFILVAITILPFYLNKNWITLSYGVIAAFISTFFFIVIFAAHVNAAHENRLDPLWTYWMGYAFATISLIASIFLIYAGFYGNDKSNYNTLPEPSIS